MQNIIVYKKKINTTVNFNQSEYGPDGWELPKIRDWLFLITVVLAPCTDRAQSWYPTSAAKMNSIWSTKAM